MQPDADLWRQRIMQRRRLQTMGGHVRPSVVRREEKENGEEEEEEEKCSWLLLRKSGFTHGQGSSRVVSRSARLRDRQTDRQTPIPRGASAAHAHGDRYRFSPGDGAPFNRVKGEKLKSPPPLMVNRACLPIWYQR